ncbi:complement C5 isoform X2 [Hemicordylus capensis]|uniref:complement C5 isoform X2 n=1 Tax=Hemicordylus capensis TaxID=884348 RepID=UPI002303CB35|nr:complement C5 isoform X2 [Hemicordylus capensis]
MNLVGVFLLLAFCGRTLTQEQTYVIAAPKWIRAGASEKVVIQAYGYEQEFPVTISIKSFPDKRTTYASGRIQLSPANKFQDSVTLTVQPNDLSSRDTNNPVQHAYLEAVSSHFTREKKIPISYENGFLFIQTDKPIYTPDQSVKVRAYSLNQELRPAQRSTTLTFVDPEGVEVDIIKEDDFTGIVSFPDFKIPPYPKFGTWTIKAKYEKDFRTSAEAKFQVKEYAMPGFSVSIEPEANFISNQHFERFRITIRASYFYNKRVALADVYIRFGIIQGAEKTMMPNALKLVQMQDGVAEYVFNSKAAVAELHYKSLQDLDGSYLYVAASVLESNGGLSEDSEFLGIRYVLSPYKLNLVATPLFVKPGLPFHIKVQVKDPLDVPARDIPVVLTASTFSEQMEETTLIREGEEPGRGRTSLNDGTALFVVNIPRNTAVLEFRIKTADASLPEENQASEQYEAKQYVSLSGSYLYINWATSHQTLRVGEYLQLSVHPSSPYSEKIHHYSYLIVSKGKIISYGIQERIERSDYQSLNFQLTQDMVPSARLLIYYIVTGEGAAELVADSVWLNIEQKCGNSLKVQLSSGSGSHSPKDSVSLLMRTQSSSFVALSAVDKAIYGVVGSTKRPMERALLQLEKSDLGCGAGGGRNNVDVFRLAGLTFLTNANAEDSKEEDDACHAITRSARSTIKEEIEKLVSQFKKEEVRKCCRGGAEQYPLQDTCNDRAKRITILLCKRVFLHCCDFVSQLRRNATDGKVIMLGRMAFNALLDLEVEIRSYFPESWLWEVHQVPGSKALSVTLPDSLTTWEIQGVGISDQGICVADPLQVAVSKEVFLSVHIPYSVVRGEQIELRGSVYNYKNSRIRFCTKVSVGEGICLFQGANTNPQGIQSSSCNRPRTELTGSSVALVKFKILPLEIGLHTINFTLLSTLNSETLVKTLRVVPEGIRKEEHEGHTLDPQGVYGTVKRQVEFRQRIPPNLVPKTGVEKTVSIKGLLLGDVFTAALSPEGLKLLANLPRGSAETELMNVVPAIFVYHYLETTNSWDLFGLETLTTRIKLRRRMREGIVSILSFRKPDYSYSMWKGGESSTWLTAFALRIFGQVYQYLELDKSSVCESLIWMIEYCQMSDGSFREISSYQPVKLQGTLPKEQKEKTLYLTAFSLIGFEKAIHICPLQRVQDAKNKAEDYLLKNYRSAQSTFSLAIVTYALALAKSKQPDARTAFSLLKREALVKVGPPLYRYWKESFNKVDQSSPSKESAKMVETTAYALLTILLHGDQAYADPIIRWLSEQQRYGGGFYSTQDTINALEALTEYSILVKRLALNMNVKVAYKNYGDFHQYRLTGNNYAGKPVEAPLNDDIEVRTGSNTGLAFVNLRRVYYKFSTSEDTCNFQLKIDVKSPNEMDPDRSYSRWYNEPSTLMACAKYRPSRGEPQSSSSHAVMDISLVSGLEANTNDLSVLTNGVDQIISNYEIREGHVIAQIDSIPAGEFLCIGFRVTEIFRVGMPSPGTFTVYEYHNPDKQCSMFYNPYGEESLVRLCEGRECKCMEAECGLMQTRADPSISVDSRREAACKSNTAYVYKVNILSSKTEGNFVKYTATLVDLYKRGEAFAQRNAEVSFIKKTSCSEVQLSPGEDYLIMGKEALKIGEGVDAKYQYPLDAMTWIEWWPSKSSCASCQDFVELMEEFVEDLFINGC